MKDSSNKLGLMISASPKKSALPAPPFAPKRASNQASPVSPRPDPSTGPAAGLGGDPNEDPSGQGQTQGGKVSRDEAGYVPMEQACGACINFHPESGDCDVVEGKFRCCDACDEHFSPADPNFKPDPRYAPGYLPDTMQSEQDPDQPDQPGQLDQQGQQDFSQADPQASLNFQGANKF